jgi:hypothetical protein
MSDFARCIRAGLIVAAALATADASAAELPFGDSRAWRVERDGAAPSFVLGTMHVTDPEVTAIPDGIRAAFDGSRVLAVELTMDAETMTRLSEAMVADDAGWVARDLTDEQRKMLHDTAVMYGIPPLSIVLFRPWALTAMFSFPPAEVQRQSQGLQPLDMQLMNRAEAAGMKLVALETVEEQLDAFTGYSDREQIDMLMLTLASIAEIDGYYARMKAAYLADDMAALQTLADEGFALMEPSLARRHEKKLVIDRNHRMAKRLAPLLEQGGAFVAIGALHLPGEDGVLNLLAAQGYRVTALR